MMGGGEKPGRQTFIAKWADAGKTLSEMVRVVVTWWAGDGSSIKRMSRATSNWTANYLEISVMG